MTVDSLTTRPAPPDRTGTTWVAVCRLADLVPERGAAALVAGVQVALFRLDGDEVLAVQQRDPFMDAHVLSRGIVGSRGDRPTVASPLLKQVFDLRTGRCLDGVGREPQHLRTWRVRVEHGVVLVAATPDPPVADGDGGAS
jgi:NAD(P)H-dependent nitrite reductase small subunit